ncbi:pseudomurein-binding repeat-containing protein, partial [Methanobacterium sp.]|uniref:pseudomurein-binding repeat-containing protein n=1 Tax=Methanobacterium sp. TaxID=2164 RepID=UPI0025E0EF3D
MWNRGEVVVKTIHESGNSIITILTILSLVLIFLLSMGPVSAADSSTIYVNNTGGNDSWDGQYDTWQIGTLYGPKKSIKNATGTVTDGGTVNIANGMYTGPGNTNITIGKNMSIVGQSQENTIIDGTKTTSIFNILNNANVILFNLTLTNGHTASNGGAICNSGTLIIENCTLNNNTATYGGAIYSDQMGMLVVVNSTFKNNSAFFGGAVFNNASTPNSSGTIIDSTFTSNNAVSMGNGGAICNSDDAYLYLANLIFTNNTSHEGRGGAIHNQGNLIVTNSNFTGNSAINGMGGAISNLNGECGVDNCTFSNNIARLGGAIYNYNNSPTLVMGSSFTGNIADYYSSGFGGAIYNMGTIYVNFSRITGNTANQGSSIYNDGGIVDASLNWWGTNNGPQGIISNNGNIETTNWLVLNIITYLSAKSTITADLTHDNSGAYHNPTDGHVPDGIPVNFNTTLGSINSPVTTINGVANTTLNSAAGGLADVSATIDSQTVHTSVIIDFSISQIIDAAQRINKFVETNKKLPTYVVIGGVSVNMAKFLHLAIQATDQIHNKDNTPIALQNDNVPGFSEEQLNSGSVTLADYLDFAHRINGYMDENHQAPPYGFIGLGKIGYQSQVYLFTRILSIYNSTGSLPSFVTVKPFTSSNIPILYTPPVTFTPEQIVAAAVVLQNTIETTKSIPNTVTVNGITVYTAQFL